MTNQAAFTINATASEDPTTGDRKYVGSNSEVLTLTLEVNPSSVLQTTYSVFSSSVPESPLASKDAPVMVFTGSGTYSESPSSPNGSVTITLPSSGAHSYNIRCVVSTVDGPEEFVRQVSIPALLSGINVYKTVPSETTEFFQRGYSDKFNGMVEATFSSSTVGTGFLISASTPSYILSDITLMNLHSSRSIIGSCSIQIQSALININYWTIRIKDTGLNASVNNMTITTEGSETIDGNSSLVLNTDGASVTLQSLSGNLYIM